jgi:hypothetical protein
MEKLELILPIALLFLSFLLKLMVDRSVEKPTAIKAFCELPVDMIFLSISFLIAYILADDKKQTQGLLIWIIYLILAIGIVFVWRRCVLYYDKGDTKSWLTLLFMNLFVTIACLVFSIGLLTSDNKEEDGMLEKTKPKIESNGTN